MFGIELILISGSSSDQAGEILDNEVIFRNYRRSKIVIELIMIPF